jgi:hypothetical protein
MTPPTETNSANPLYLRRAGVFLLMVVLAGFFPLGSQFTPEEIDQRPQWEEFLAAATVTDSEQMGGREAVTQPWKLTLEKDEIVRNALWKNPEGRMGGYIEGWRYEIAAYLMDKHLGLNMVPPTVEFRFRGDRGSCQLWIDDVMSLKDKEDNNIPVPGGLTLVKWNRATYLLRAFDNLIANEDRHQNQILITKDWRILLIDHSRSFRYTKKFRTSLINKDKPMSALPRAFVERLKELNAEGIAAATQGYITDTEIAAILDRRDLILAEIEKLIARDGEIQVLY